VARQRRHTEPLKTLRGTLTDYAEIDRFLLDGEFKGRSWIFERSQAAPLLSTYDDHDIRALHRVMFGDILEWAGEFRTDERGPGGQVFIPWYHVAVAVRTFTDNLGAWVAALSPDPVLEELAGVMASAHHEFQRIHPFRDTNGRTGRVLDLYLLWVTFGLKKDSVASSPTIEPFPTAAEEDAYYEGLREADNHRPERLRNYYCERLAAVFEAG
jgi:fido (protein-threonine AMPylation protein)